MARRKSEGEKQMLAVGAKADEELNERFPGNLQILHSWSGGDLILDVQDSEGEWHRLLWVLEDDTEISQVRTLA